MTVEVYLRSFGGAGADTGALLIAFGAELDSLGAWQVDLGDGASAEVSGLGAPAGQPDGARAGLVRLTGLTKRGADLLYALARGGGFAMILPDPEGSDGVRIFLPDRFDRALLPASASADQAQTAESPAALFVLLSECLQKTRPADAAPDEGERPTPASAGWLQRLLNRLTLR